MAEYGNNYDYGESPYYKDEETPESVEVSVRASIFNGIIVSV